MSNKYKTPFDGLDWSEMQKKNMLMRLMAFKYTQSPAMESVWVKCDG